MTTNALDLTRARATLLALRAGLLHPEDLTVPGVLLLPEGVPLLWDQAAGYLAAKPKPINCVGFPALGCLAVASWTMTEQDIEAKRRLDETEVEWLERELGDQPSAMVALKGSNEQMLLALSQIRTWYSEYGIMFVDRLVERPSPSESAGNVALSIAFRATIGGIRARRHY